MYPGSEFSYEFYDESIAKFYKNEQNIARLLKWATGLAIFISCMGLLGTVAVENQGMENRSDQERYVVIV